MMSDHTAAPIRPVCLRNGRVFDGSGNLPFTADVLLTPDGIKTIGTTPAVLDVEEVDCTGLYVTPGFIDAHSHSDFTLPTTPDAPALLDQGITTVVTGNCGFSAFPWTNPPAAAGFYPGAFFNPDLSRLWSDLETFRLDIHKQAPAVNIAPLVGHGTVRHGVLAQNGAATRSEVAEVTRRIECALDQGSFGVSLGLAYPEGRHADHRELTCVAELVAERDVVLAVHVRDERGGCVEAVQEVIGVARSAGARLQISHLKAMGSDNWGLVSDVLELIDESLAEGADISLDMYPYPVGATQLTAALPQWADQVGDLQLKQHLRNPAMRERLRADLEAGKGYVQLTEVGLSSLSRSSFSHLQGQGLVEAAGTLAQHPADLLLDILAETGGAATMLVNAMSNDDVDAVLNHEASLIGSDGWVLDATPTAHPRNFNTFLRTLIRATGDEQRLATAIHKQTGATANRFNIGHRGRLAPGAASDVAVLDVTRLKEGRWKSGSYQAPTGIKHLFVNGVPVRGPHARGNRAGLVLNTRTEGGAS